MQDTATSQPWLPPLWWEPPSSLTWLTAIASSLASLRLSLPHSAARVVQLKYESGRVRFHHASASFLIRVQIAVLTILCVALYSWFPAPPLRAKLLSLVRHFVTPWTIAYEVPPSMEFSRQEYWSGLLFPSPGHLPNSRIEPRSPALQADDFTVWATREAPTS